MGNHKNPFFSLYSTHMVGVFYLDSNLLTPITLKKYIKKKKLLKVFKPFCTLDSSIHLTTIKQLPPQLPCDPSINPHHPSAVCTETIIISGFVLQSLLYPMLISLASGLYRFRLQYFPSHICLSFVYRCKISNQTYCDHVAITEKKGSQRELTQQLNNLICRHYLGAFIMS